jgi:hypothetical protein
MQQGTTTGARRLATPQDHKLLLRAVDEKIIDDSLEQFKWGIHS